MTQPLILVAAGGLARETASAVELLGGYELLGCLDDAQELWGKQVGSFTVLGGLDEILAYPSARVVVCAGKGERRRTLVERLSARAVDADRYGTVIHPSVHVPRSCHVGPGSVILAQVALTADVTVGRHVVVMPNCTLTHDNVLEDYATLAAGVSLGGGVRVGATAYVGMNASVRERVRVGAGSVVGMSAAAVEDIPTGQTWAGVPARPLCNPSRKATA